MGNGGEQDKWLEASLQSAPLTATDACPDAETLAAWADRGLTAAAAAAVEVHASSCARCTAVLAEIVRSAPLVSVRPAWSPARVVRWAAPLAAAAAAVVLWIVVPDRPITPAAPSMARDSSVQLRSDTPEPSRPESSSSEPPSASAESAAPESIAPEARTLNQNAESSTQSAAPQAKAVPEPPAAVEEQQYGAQRRELAPPPAFGTTAVAPPAAAPVPMPPPAASTDTFADTTTLSRRAAADSATSAAESIAAANPLIHWRVVNSAAIERSTDGGKSWMRATAPASSMARIRAVDSDRAVVTTSDGAEFYTVNAGRSWTRVQEKSAAPF